MRTRRAAIEPQHEQRSGVRFVAPIDGDRGGTWLSVNEYGITICLLNGACLSDQAPEPRFANAFSRGLIPLTLADAPTARDACERLAQMDLTRFPAFTTVIAEPGLPVAIAEWDGATLALLPHGEAFLPLVSSSVNSSDVRRHRQEAFARAITPEEFHHSHEGGPSAFSPCMHRDDAETVSYSQVLVTPQDVILSYSAGPPCRGVPLVERCLTRVS